MSVIYFSFLILIPFSILSIIYNKRFVLSILLALESSLLIILVVMFLVSGGLVSSYTKGACPLFMMALAAVEASMGLSLLTLISRSFSTCNMKTLNLLKK